MRRWRLNRAAILASTPLRQALGLMALVFAILLVTLGFAYVALRSSSEDSIRADLKQQTAVFQVAANPETLSVIVSAEARAADPAERAIAFVLADGRQVGNVHVVRKSGQWVIGRNPDFPALSQHGYFTLVMPLAGGFLVIGESQAPIAELTSTFLAILIFSFVPSVLVSAAYGAWAGMRTRRRVSVIEDTLDALTEGRLDARVARSAIRAARGDDLARIGARLNVMAATQESTVEALRQVSADIAHDLKTPMQRISVLLSQLQTELPEGSEARQLAARANAEAEGAVAVFHALLQIAQIEGGSPKNRFTPVDLGALAGDITELYAASAEEAGGQIALAKRPSGSVMVLGDRSLLGQMLSNLIENAIRHAGDAPQITVEVVARDELVELRVRDRGPGIPEAERGQVLQRLYRLEHSRTTPGNGLGLALVDAVAGLHDAQLTLSDNAPGLVVTLGFPRI
ncbi:HAMP domain-containing histidine kinase [Thioclava sp. BHET1]|nr:HAMP domain-containing histidine kinase [Thioclava sp. BHET1]